MSQAFLTVNEKTYVWHDYTKRPLSLKPVETIYNEPPKGDIFIDANSIGCKTFANTSIEDLQKIGRKLYRKRNRTVFQKSYCLQEIMAQDREDTAEVRISENELIEYGNRLYAKPTKKIMKPLATARKIYGYIRPKNVYTGLSEVQDTFGRLGYEILLTNYLRTQKKKA